MVLGTTNGSAVRQRVVVVEVNGWAYSPRIAREAEKERGGPGEETPKDLLSPTRLHLLKFPELPQIDGIMQPIMSLFISKP